ncbi:putative polysaccharide biosynthesis protein [Lactobacillus mulieris]|uniref:Polysaccharide biosynthesis protein n=1 Tax=Lactobacillus mulieris TaxID=2508708 RepID=A0AAW5WZK8_9LACO|nr:polysaccharide biosynthesis protein [Lactobacillus mulieris]MCZ3622777.1 polysaccharide biosynthesis protein [Lactobacillus mulieris]MCZ3624457.1 polysaccharide biosynthesis protein [Lactobacillus mulieris]MCZ3636797.1 polysaccharide biosynthesis protein [Lactobacillus mulieris]MCZ3690577.1 polysaccharide biosynthesis protein [Lactobacillus mulieris]MCZ3696628.1 polysaccharide biosynthesis protein [Lactobacillus mulieris]
MKNKNIENKDSQAQLLKGSAWMTAGSILSRILGALYIIPWYAWMGKDGNLANAITAQSYNIYSLFIIVSTAGIPGAVAKQIAKYNALNEYGVSRKLFHRGLLLMIGFGIVCAGLMFGLAPILAGQDPRQIPVLKSLSYAILIIPLMSIMRGYFQGFNDMMPSALSQFIEQLARVAWMLMTAYVIMKMQDGNYLRAVTQSNLAAAIGAMFGILLLVYYYQKQKREMDDLVENSNNELQVSTNSLLLEIVQQSIPFIIIDSGINIFQLVDQYTFHPIMASFVHASFDQIESMYALFGLNANKLIMIIVSLSTAMAVTAIPLLSGAKARRDYQDIRKQIENTLELFFFFMIPSAFGMAAISTPIYTIFYGFDPVGSNVLFIASFTAIILGLFTVLMAVQQGLSENILAIKYLVVGLIIKCIIQYPLIRLFQINGPLLATDLAFMFTILLSLKHLKVAFHFNFKRTKRRFIGIVSFSTIMFIVIFALQFILGRFIPADRRVTAMILVGICVGVGILVYGFLALISGLAHSILGPKISKLERKLHINYYNPKH